ncbi:MAG: hypothetical protein QOG99_2500, partial [Frankiales bacterium]|nr:hypothetical protein [Frankiales bacterium]
MRTTLLNKLVSLNHAGKAVVVGGLAAVS